MDEFESIIAQTLRRLRDMEESSRELAELLPENDPRRAILLAEAQRAQTAIRDVSEMFRRVRAAQAR